MFSGILKSQYINIKDNNIISPENYGLIKVYSPENHGLTIILFNYRDTGNSQEHAGARARICQALPSHLIASRFMKQMSPAQEHGKKENPQKALSFNDETYGFVKLQVSTSFRDIISSNFFYRSWTQNNGFLSTARTKFLIFFKNYFPSKMFGNLKLVHVLLKIVHNFGRCSNSLKFSHNLFLNFNFFHNFKSIFRKV